MGFLRGIFRYVTIVSYSSMKLRERQKISMLLAADIRSRQQDESNLALYVRKRIQHNLQNTSAKHTTHAQ